MTIIADCGVVEIACGGASDDGLLGMGWLRAPGRTIRAGIPGLSAKGRIARW